MSNNKVDYVEKLGNLIIRQMRGVGEAIQPFQPEFGSIDDEISLIPDNSPGPIPKDEYALCASAQGIKSGDRVFICWVGCTPVVVDILIRE